MGDITAIEWATHTWNPWEGCTKVSPGCAHCYAATRNHRFGHDNWGAGKPRRRTSEDYWRRPHLWNARVHPGQERPRVFPSLCDWLDDEVPADWLADFLEVIQDTPHLDWLLLTKRPERWLYRLAKAYSHLLLHPTRAELRTWLEEWRDGTAPDNVWLGVSVEDQPRAEERIPILQGIPSTLRFLSVEPLLGPVNLPSSAFDGAGSLSAMEGIHWVIVGGESGPGARPCNAQWIRDLVKQCRAAQVPCFVKQLGSNSVEEPFRRYTLKHLKGGDPSEWPFDLQVRQFPCLNYATP
jgi:protein gp37